jgi:hypothetical protein
MRAINANADKATDVLARSILEGKIHQSFTVAADELFMRGYIDREQRIKLSSIIGDVLGEFGEMSEEVLQDEMVNETDAEQIASKEADEEVEDKSAFMTMSAPLTLAELDQARDEMKQHSFLQAKISDFMAVVGNIFSISDNPKSDIRKLAAEFVDDMEDDEEEPLEKDLEEIQELKEEELEDELANSFMVWKQEDGSYRWLGISTNKFRDDDSPSEILAEEAHIKFVEGVEKGIYEYPELYVWHIPSSVGKADTEAYDDSGFRFTSGLFNNDKVAQALMETEEDLAMSHGMPSHLIERDEKDASIIVSYVDEEVSVLPLYAAANKLTDFKILMEEKMAIIPQEKREKVAQLLGEKLTAELETSLEEKGAEAIAAGIEYKEEGEEDVEVLEETGSPEEGAETLEEIVADEADVEAEPDPEPVTEEKDAADEKVDDEPMGDNQEELATVLATIVKGFNDGQEHIMAKLEALDNRIGSMEGTVADLEKEDGEKIATKVAQTPPASLAALVIAQLGEAGGSVIGNREASVHGNEKLAKDKPPETPVEGEGEYNGLFINHFMKG